MNLILFIFCVLWCAAYAAEVLDMENHRYEVWSDEDNSSDETVIPLYEKARERCDTEPYNNHSCAPRQKIRKSLSASSALSGMKPVKPKLSMDPCDSNYHSIGRSDSLENRHPFSESIELLGSEPLLCVSRNRNRIRSHSFCDYSGDEDVLVTGNTFPDFPWVDSPKLASTKFSGSRNMSVDSIPEEEDGEFADV
jgi:hypothetical protein